MKIQKLDGLAYSEKAGIIGVITSADYINGTINVIDENGEHVLNIEEAQYLEALGELNGKTVYNKDVLVISDDVEAGEEDLEKLWEISLEENGKLVLHLLEIKDNELVRKQKGESFGKEALKSFDNILEVLANFYEIEVEEEEEATVDFNIKIVRMQSENELEYLYACNNESAEEVDLIKVVFVGAKLLEEKYSRQTVTHEEYLEYIKTGILKEVSPQELQNYVLGVTHGYDDAPVDLDLDDEEDADADYDSYCADCGEDYFECDC